MRSAGITASDIRNKEQILRGVGNLGKVVAVSTFAIGIIDIVEGSDTVQAEEFETRNNHLNGLEHDVTGVQFAEKTIELPSGELVTGTFPVFDSSFSVFLTDDIYHASDSTHFDIANDTLYQSINDSPNIVNELGLTQLDVQMLANGTNPEGFVWHHSEQPGVLQLVKEELHHKTGHTGGRENYGVEVENFVNVLKKNLKTG